MYRRDKLLQEEAGKRLQAIPKFTGWEEAESRLLCAILELLAQGNIWERNSTIHGGRGLHDTSLQAAGNQAVLALRAEEEDEGL